MLGYTGLGLNETSVGANDPSMETKKTPMGSEKAQEWSYTA